MIPDTLPDLLDDVQLLQLPDPEFLINGVLQRKGIFVLYGPPGGGKTTLIAQMLVCLTNGIPFLGRPVNHIGSVLYVAAEDPSGFKKRIQAAKLNIGLDLDTPTNIFTYPDMIDIRDDGHLWLFLEKMKQFTFPAPLTTLVLDTYAAVTPGAKENASEDVTKAVRAAQVIRDTLGCAVVFVHHSNAAGSRERGHSALRGACDGMLSLVPVDDIIVLKSEKIRNASPLEPIELKLNPLDGTDGLVTLQLADSLPDCQDLSTIQKALLAVFQDLPEEGEKLFVIKDAVPDIPERSFYRAIKVLKEKGLIEKARGAYRLRSPE